ncbi:MAG: hypothetical protein IJ011_08630 [Clostridia bacterium]|nr:hypothetical protein [Clostridia bacterium]
MKRLAALIIAVITAIAFAAQIVSAEAHDGTAANDTALSSGAYESLGSGAVTFICEYSDDAKRIEVSGNVNYNILVKYGKYTLEILRIAPNQSIEEAITSDEPNIAARMNIAAKFEMSFEIKTATERFSRYAVILRSPEGGVALASTPQGIFVSSNHTYLSSSKDDFKGILPTDTADVSVSGDMGFGSAVIPVYYDRLINESMNGYMYPHEDMHCFFDKTYIDELDAKIRTYSATGARVYLQLLLPTGGQASTLLGAGTAASDAYYGMPDVYDEETLSKIYTYVKFLVSRYNGYTDGQIGGIIVGKQIDVAKYNYNGGLPLNEYAEKYAFYLTVVANTARFENSDIDIVIPFSNYNSYSSSSETRVSDYSPSELLENILAELDGFFSTGFNCSTMIESGTVPLGIYEQSTEGGTETDNDDLIFSLLTEDKNEIGVNNISLYDQFLANLRGNYKSAPKSYIYCWQVPEGLSGNALECSYVYSYYTLISKYRISSFVVSFSDADTDAMESIKKTVERIDTASGSDECAKLLKYFGAKSWSDIIKAYSEDDLILRTEYPSSNNKLSNSEWKGGFSYFNFSTGDINGWYDASYSKGIKSDYGEGGQRVLRQTVEKTSGAAHSDMFCLYEYDENLIYTPALKFEMQVTDGETSSGAVYEITVTVGTEGSSVSKSQIVRSGELFEIWLDAESYGKEHKASYIKVSTRSISGDAGEYSVWIYDVVGYSRVYDSEQLSLLINEERRSIRNQSLEADSEANDGIIYWIVFSIVIVAIFVGGIMVMVIRRDDGVRGVKHRKNEEDQ